MTRAWCRCGARLNRPAGSPYCHFCTRTVALIKAGRCVSCTQPAVDPVDLRVEGLCHECRTHNVRTGVATRHLLHLAAKARYRMERAA